MSRFAKLGSHHGLKSLDFLPFCGNDQIEQGLCSSRERQRQRIAESAVVLGHNEVGREQYSRNIHVDEMIGGWRYRIRCWSLHVLML